MSPRGYAGFYFLQQQVFGCTFDNLVDEVLPFGSRSDEGHCAAQDVVELGYFVESVFAHNASEGRDARVVVAGESRASLFGVDIHRAEFVHLEGFAAVTDAFLCVEYGARRGAFDDYGGEEKNWRKEDECEDGEDDVGQALDGILPFFHRAWVDGDERRVENGVDFDRAVNDIAQVGGDLDYDVVAAVEEANYIIDTRVVVVVDGENDLFDPVFFDDGVDVRGEAQIGHQLRQTFIDGAVDLNESDKDVPGINRLVVKFLIGVVGFGATADEERGESQTTRVDAVCGARGDGEPAGVGQTEMKQEEDEEAEVVVAIGDDIVVEQQGEEDDYDADERGPEGHLQLLEPGFAEDVLVGALHSVEAAPGHGQKNDAPPEIGVVEHITDVVETAVFDRELAIEEKQPPRKQGREGIPEKIFCCLKFRVQKKRML